ncbi:MAG: S-layer homology domain-containing protein [Clostridia bacterium]|nr:S-layer homology domain-containing protein [Clostridia bacterium]
MKKLKVCMLMICLIMCFSSITLAANFYDVKGTVYEGVVNRIARLGIINGISETAFAPNKGITRAELAKMIVFTKGLQTYADTSKLNSPFKDAKGHWAENYIAVAAEIGLLKGYDDGTFRPDQEVSYAEVIAIILRVLGYVNIDETQGNTWYFGYTKRMYEIELDKGVPAFKNIEAPAKRGDVAIFWWNMLVSERWAVTAESDGSGLFYTYSPKTQLQVLFPKFSQVKGRLNSIANGSSGDFIEVTIGGRAFDTDSVVPIYALGGNATGVYDTEEKILYGFSVDEELDEYEIIAGPIFYLEEEGYNLKKAESDATYGSKGEANYAYLIVSKVDGTILRVVYLDASNSYYVDSINIKNQEDKDEDNNSDSDDEDEEEEIKIQDIFINDEEEALTTSEAVIIKNGKKVKWEDLEEKVVLTELIPQSLYTYEDSVIEGDITNYSDLDNLYIDDDKYIVSENCVYTIYGEDVDEEEENEIVFHDYHKEMKKAKFEELMVRNIKFYMNAAEEISMIEFGKYMPSNIIEKYDNEDMRFLYITGLSYTSGEDTMVLTGKRLNGKTLKLYANVSDDYQIGDLINVSEVEGKTAKNMDYIDTDIIYDENDVMIIYDCDEEFYNNAFGEYMIVEDTLFFNVNKVYKDNSNEKLEDCQINQISDLKALGDLSKYKIVLFCNTDMEIDIVFAERELNKTTYPVGRVIEITKIKTDDDSTPVYKDHIPSVNVKLATIGGRTNTYTMLSGECLEGELVTYELKDESLTIKERFKTVFLGYEKDLIVKSFDEETRIATLANASEDLDLTEYTYDFNGKEIDLVEYKYLVTTVRTDEETGEWKFINGVFYQKENLKLQPGDRIAFGELNGIAVVYRGY